MSGITEAAESFCLAEGTSFVATNATTHEAGGAFGTVAVSILTSFLSLVIVVGNGLIIVSVAVVKKLRQPANYLIVSLALSDFLVGFIVLPLTIVYDIGGEWIFGSMVCDVHVSFDVICCTASIMNLCMISIDRYLMITKPMTYPKRRNGRLMVILIATAWLISCLIIIPALFGFTENVKDGPGWVQLKPLSVIGEGGSVVFGPSELNGTMINGSHHAYAALDQNQTTFWDPGKSSKQTRDWYMTIDLGQTYQVSKIGIHNAGDEIHDTKSFTVEANVCDEENQQYSKENFSAEAGTSSLQEGKITGNVEARYIRMTVNETFSMEQPKLREFKVYGEKLRGKTCLISQEVWFTIYSTVGAFYIPLSVMLCMYWKIYVEASRFSTKDRNRSPSCAGSQDGSYSPPATPPDAAKLVHSSSSSKVYMMQARNVNNNFKSEQTHNRDDCDCEAQENLLSNGTSMPNSNDSKEEIMDYILYDEETVSSECEFYSGGNVTADAESCEEKISMTSEERPLNNQSATFTPLGSNRLHSKAFTSRRNIIPSSLSPSNGLPNGNVKTALSLSQLQSLSEKNMTNAFDQKNETFKSYRRNSKTDVLNGGLVNGGWRFPTISENNILDFSNKHSCNAVAEANLITADKAVQKPTYTRSCQSANRAENKEADVGTRYSVSAESTECCRKPLFFRSCSSPSRSLASSFTSNNQAAKRRHSTGQRKCSVSSKIGQYAGDCPSSNTSRRPTMLSQLRRRVSMATSRDRMRNVKATRTLGIIVGAFTFCWLPFFIVTFLRPFVCENPESQDCIPLWLVRLVLWLGYLNSALNPLIYIGFSPDLRETFRFLLSCKCTNVDRRLAQTELRQAISRERSASLASRCVARESIM